MKSTIQLCITIILFLLNTILNAQDKTVLVTLKQEGNSLVTKAINNSNSQQEVTVTMEVKNCNGYKGPVTKLVGAKKTVEMVRLTPLPNKVPQVSYNYSYVPKLSDAEIAAQEKQLQEKRVSVLGEINKGIILFSQDGCPRCSYAVTYLLENDIDFKMVETTEDEAKKQAMWEIIRAENPDITEITFPVFLVNGKLSYSIEDLKGFTSELDVFKIN